MAAHDDELAAQMERLRGAYGRKLPARLSAIADALRSLVDGGWEPDKVEASARLAHNLAGTGETFGYPELGRAARVLELAIRERDEDPALRDSESHGDTLAALFDAVLSRACDAGVDVVPAMAIGRTQTP